MIETAPFETHVERYETWFDRHKYAFESELLALTEHIPDASHGIQVGLGTGKYALPLNIKEGVEPSSVMRIIATERGLEVLDGVAESLPYKDMLFDFVLFVTICHLDSSRKAFKEAHRVLKKGGSMIVGFIDRNSEIGLTYESRRPENIFYHTAKFHTPEKVIALARTAGFKQIPKSTQTLFRSLDQITDTEPIKEGHGEGSYVVMEFVKSH